MTTLPAWDAVADVLAEVDAPTGPAEAHGILCGLLCAPAAEPATLWLREALDRGPEAPPPEPLDAVYRDTARQLDDDAFAFELLLPPDDYALALRAQALAAWCSGFAYAIGIGGVSREALDDDGREFLADVAEIAQVDPGADGADSDAEAAYTELTEYLRVGALGLRMSAPARARGGDDVAADGGGRAGD